jgi:N-acyl-L-homoserine lactone synthetase
MAHPSRRRIPEVGFSFDRVRAATGGVISSVAERSLGGRGSMIDRVLGATTTIHREAARSPDDMDARAAAFVRASPATLRVAGSAAEVGAVCRLRLRTIVERGWGVPEDYPDGMEADAYDDGATHVVAVDDGAIVGCSRLVFPAPGRVLPTEATFGIVLEPRGRVVNIDRTLVVPSHRSRDHRIFAALIGWSWLELRSRGFVACGGIVSRGVLGLYRRLGVELDVVGGPRPVWAEDRVAVVFGVRSRMPGAARSR